MGEGRRVGFPSDFFYYYYFFRVAKKKMSTWRRVSTLQCCSHPSESKGGEKETLSNDMYLGIYKHILLSQILTFEHKKSV